MEEKIFGISKREFVKQCQTSGNICDKDARITPDETDILDICIEGSKALIESDFEVFNAETQL